MMDGGRTCAGAGAGKPCVFAMPNRAHTNRICKKGKRFLDANHKGNPLFEPQRKQYFRPLLSNENLFFLANQKLFVSEGYKLTASDIQG